MPGMYNHCDQGYSSGTTVCAVERNNKKIEVKSEGILDMYPEFWTHEKLNLVHMDASLNFVGGIHFVFAWILLLL